jgi:hypothetical protein
MLLVKSIDFSFFWKKHSNYKVVKKVFKTLLQICEVLNNLLLIQDKYDILTMYLIYKTY